jgi:predicted aminopeptidase
MVIFNRIPVQDMLARPDLADMVQQQLALVASIREFAAEIGLEPGDSYTTFYDTGKDPISWNVSASPPDRFEAYLWEFPIIGSVPYKGFFEKVRAVDVRDELKAEGFDAIVRPVSAYSTLGFFSDPILSSMLDYTPDQLADLILHELTHAVAYAPEQTDFNESLATFVGRQGSLLFLIHHYGSDTPLLEQALQRRADAALFRKFMVATVASLDSLYSLALPIERVLLQRQAIFAHRKEEFTKVRDRFRLSNYDGFLKWELNNARLLSYRRYNRDLDLFAATFRLSGEDLAASIDLFIRCANEDEPWACLRDYTKVAPD